MRWHAVMMEGTHVLEVALGEDGVDGAVVDTQAGQSGHQEGGQSVLQHQDNMRQGQLLT